MEYAQSSEIERLDGEIDKTKNYFVKFALKVDVSERFQKIEQDFWEEMATKLEKKVFDRKVEAIEVTADKEKKRQNKDMGSLRELVESMRRKTDETLHSMIEVRTEIDTKLNAKEG